MFHEKLGVRLLSQVLSRSVPADSIDAFVQHTVSLEIRGCHAFSALGPALGWLRCFWQWEMLRKACSSLQKPLLKRVSHARKVFTPLTTFPKSKLGAFAHRTLKKCAEKNLARETRQSFSVAAGDNKAEGRLGAVKGNMRRLGVLGRWNGSSKKKRVQVLASAALHRMPGIGTILKACKQYRLALSRGQAKLPPRDSFSPDALPWLDA